MNKYSLMATVKALKDLVIKHKFNPFKLHMKDGNYIVIVTPDYCKKPMTLDDVVCYIVDGEYYSFSTDTIEELADELIHYDKSVKENTI